MRYQQEFALQIEYNFSYKYYMISERGKAYRRGDMEAYNKLRNEVQREICLTKEKYYETIVNELRTASSGKWHRHVKNMTGSKSSSSLNMDHLSKDPKELTGIINNHFASACNQMPCLSRVPAFVLRFLLLLYCQVKHVKVSTKSILQKQHTPEIFHPRSLRNSLLN